MKRAALLVAACGDDGADKNPLSAPQAAVVEWREGQTVVALGTSLTFGSGCKIFPCDGSCALPDSSFPVLLQTRLKLPVINLGVPGATTRDGLLHHQMQLSLAAEFGVPIVEYIFEDIWWREELMFDPVHPNGRGYLLMEGNIARGLDDFFAAGDLLM